MKMDLNGMLNPMVAIGIGIREAVVSGRFTFNLEKYDVLIA